MATNGFQEGVLKIHNFTKGINEQIDDTLVKFNETTNAYNVDNSRGTLSPYELPKEKYKDTLNIKGITNFYGTEAYMLGVIGEDLVKLKDFTKTTISANQKNLNDALCFENQGTKITVLSNGDNELYMFDGTNYTRLKNRRPSYNEEGVIDKWYDANGKECKTEADVNTYAPKCKFIELHYDRLWLAGDSENTDRVYFSTADQRGFDIQDYTMPIDEEEANMHGGFVDVPSFDGGKIIGLKVIFNDLCIFKDKTIFKIFGNNPSNYQIVQLFSSSGAICDKSISTGSNGAFFLNNDGIYFYDGTNVNIVSQRIQNIISKIDIQQALSTACSVFYDSCYYLSVPSKGSETNDILIKYDTINGSFMIYKDLNIKAFNEFNKTLYMIVGNTICSKETTGLYANMMWETPYNDVGYKNAKKRSEYLYFTAEGNGTLNIDCITDNKTKSISVPISEETKVYKKKLKNKGRIFKLKFYTDDGKYINVTSPELIVEIDRD